MKFIAFKTADGTHKGNISFYCRLLHVTRQGFYQYLGSTDKFGTTILTHLFARTSAENPPQSTTLRPVFHLVRTKNLRQSGRPHFISDSLMSKDRPWKYQELADAMMQIHAEDECNDTYGRIRMYQALKIRQSEGIRIPSERTVYRIMEEIG